MIKITRDDILKLGHISNISISEDEIPMLIDKLSAVLSYASYLKDVAAELQRTNPEVAPLPVRINITRDDEVFPCDPESLLALAPLREENFYVVPMILKN